MAPSEPVRGGAVPGQGRRRLTLQDIADAAGVSPGLVSMVLRGRPGPNADTAARVTEVAQRLGYRANRTASQLASRRTRLLGVTMTPGNPYHGELVEEILQRTHERGYEVLLSPVTRTHEELSSIQTLVDSRCEVVVLLNSTLTTQQLTTALDGVPAVCVGRPLDVPDVDVVRTDDITAMGLLVDHLVGLGHTSIAHVDGGGDYLPEVRRLGYEEAMHRHGLTPLVLPGGETEQHGAEAAADLLRHDVTAAVTYNDLCAVGLMDRLQKLGVRIPDDLSVTGFDDDRLSGLHGIDLTTIDPSKLEQARLAVDWAVQRIEEERSERAVHDFPPRLVVRGSSGPVPQRRSRRMAAARAAEG
ncbi:LacI family DNA-binding transcriptional regulator [Kineosporia sp. R_H_3]|uniref:LacI family DNA-binding transcriptional regulator n=1 Tax=Kineosporia sp. R_H_3 TaxID=1961848 RepID=UPI000B4AF55A|nr:LacI family DNA-binding transcriptional regulator [Kineosporia sp. R_H_3]